MTKRELGLLIVRLLALYLLVTSAGLLASVQSYLQFPTTSAIAPSPLFVIALATLPFFMQVAFSFLLWLSAPVVGRLLIGEASENEPIAQWQPREVAQMGLIFIGFGCLLRSLLAAGNFISFIGVLMGIGNSMMWRNSWSGLLVGALQAVCGLVLVGGARFLSHWINPRREISAGEYGHDQA